MTRGAIVSNMAPIACSLLIESSRTLPTAIAASSGLSCEAIAARISGGSSKYLKSTRKSAPIASKAFLSISGSGLYRSLSQWLTADWSHAINPASWDCESTAASRRRHTLDTQKNKPLQNLLILKGLFECRRRDSNLRPNRDNYFIINNLQNNIDHNVDQILTSKPLRVNRL